MSLHRRNPKRDANEAAIVQALEAIGVAVHRVSSAGLPDLLCEYRGRWLPVEVKMPGEKLTPAQKETFGRSPFPIVETVADAVRLFGGRL